MKVTLGTTGLDKVKSLMASLSGPALRQAQAKALNDAAYQVRRTMQQEFRDSFDRVTPYIERSPAVRQATTDKLEASIEPSYMGSKGTDPFKILRAHVDGGSRRDKRSEVALRRIGILPAGYQTAIPKVPFPGSDDGRGNVRGPFLVQLLSYFRAFGEQGYRANMTDRRKASLAAGTTKQAGRRYFVAYGRLRSGVTRHLAAGIWAASGTHGSNLQPVLMFVKNPSYKPRLSMERIARNADVANYLPRRMRWHIRNAAGV